MNAVSTATALEIQPIGLRLEPDSSGVLVNPCQQALIVAPWRQAIDEITTAYRYYLKQHLVAVYVRGSVARGTAVAGVSDIDTFAVMSANRWQQDLSWLSVASQRIGAKYSFQTGIEMQVMTADDLTADADTAAIGFTLKTLSVCVWGQDLAPDLPAYGMGLYLQKDLLELDSHIQQVQQQLSALQDAAEIRRCCQWIMKIIVRAGHGLVLRAENSFSRDLYPCYASFCKYYPQLQSQMYQAFQLAVQPTAEQPQIQAVLSGIGAWLSAEARRQSPGIWLPSQAGGQ